MMILLDVLFDLLSLINLGFAVWAVVGWLRLFNLNHTKLRYLYILWLIVSGIFGGIYLVTILTTPQGHIISSGASLLMILFRPAAGLILGASALTSEVMYHQRLLVLTRQVKNGSG